MKCPICTVDLVMTDRSGIEIDYCPQCRGIWLDRGELDKIIERSVSQNSSPRVPPPPRQEDSRRPDYDHRHDYDDDRDEYYQGKKKKSFLGDLFDF